MFKHRKIRVLLWLRKLLFERNHQNWRERERHYVAQQQFQLDCQILYGADALYMDNKILEEVIRPCIDEVPPAEATQCVTNIITNRAHGSLNGVPFWRTPESGAVDDGIVTMTHLILDVLRRMVITSDTEREVLNLLKLLERLCPAIPFEKEIGALTELFEEIYIVLSALMIFNDNISQPTFQLLYQLFRRANTDVHMNIAGESSFFFVN